MSEPNTAAPATPAADPSAAPPAGGAPDPKAGAPSATDPGGTPPSAASASPAGTGDGASGQPSSEPSKETGSPAEPQSPAVRKAFAKLAEEKAKLRARAQELSTAEADAKAFRELRAKYAENPAVLAEAFGEDLFEKLVAHYEKVGRAPTTDDRVAQLERQLQEQRAAEEKARKEAETATRRQQIEGAARATAEHVKAAGDKYELINTLDAHGLVWDTMVEYTRLHPGEFLTADQAAEHVEKHLETQEQERLARIAKTKKLSGKFAPAPAAPPSEGNRAPANSGPSTLTSRVNGEAPPPQQTRALTREESIREAAKLLALPS